MPGAILDLDGCLVRGTEALPGAPEAVSELRRAGYRLIVFTNESQKSPDQLAARLALAGFDFRPAEILTAGLVAAEFLERRFRGGRVLALTGAWLKSELESRGLRLLTLGQAQEADVVLAGRDPNFGQENLAAACRALWSGAAFVATNLDRSVPGPDGPSPGTGAMVASIIYATRKRPAVAGKPSRLAARRALYALGCPPEETVVIGDQIEQDLGLARAAGIRAILLTSGTTAPEEARAVVGALRPAAVLEDISQAADWLNKNSQNS